jgi:hypothetical protein
VSNALTMCSSFIATEYGPRARKCRRVLFRRRQGQKSGGRHDISDSTSTGKHRLALGNPVPVTYSRILDRADMAAMATALTLRAELRFSQGSIALYQNAGISHSRSRPGAREHDL